MAAGRSAALRIDWSNVTTKLGLKGSTAASLQAFKKRNDDARRKVAQLRSQSQTVDFAHYRGSIANSAAVNEVEQQFKNFTPKTYDLERQLKMIETFEVQAIKGAEETQSKVDQVLRELNVTLKNVTEARPFEEMTVDEVCKAEPRIDKKVDQYVSKGKWWVPGYEEKFGNLSVL